MEEFKLDTATHIAHLEESVKSAHKRLDELAGLTQAVYTLAANIENMQKDVTKMSDRLREVEAMPAKRWNLVVTTIITGVVSAVIGAVIGYFSR